MALAADGQLRDARQGRCRALVRRVVARLQLLPSLRLRVQAVWFERAVSRHPPALSQSSGGETTGRPSWIDALRQAIARAPAHPTQQSHAAIPRSDPTIPRSVPTQRSHAAIPHTHPTHPSHTHIPHTHPTQATAFAVWGLMVNLLVLCVLEARTFFAGFLASGASAWPPPTARCAAMNRIIDESSWERLREEESEA